MKQVLVSHPHVAPFATGVAAGLAARGMLARYVSGVVAAASSPGARLIERVARSQPAAANRIVAGVPAGALWSLGPVELGARLAARLAMGAGLRSPKPYDAMFLAHDAAVATLPWPALDGVYAYEDGALWTFARAARRDLARVWDLPLPHYAWLERMWREETARWPGAMGEAPPVEPAWKQRRKDAELRAATLVSVASRFTAESLEPLGLRVPVVVTPYGFPVREFTPKTRAADGPFTVLSVGTHDLRKGTPYLLEAFARANLPDARLLLVGGMRLRRELLQRWAPLFDGGRIEHVPHRAKEQLGDVYRAADLLAFPTLGDGFGIVLQEAMCCGTPALTTRCGGGPECITDGVDGWLAPERDVDALVDRLRFASQHRDQLFAMGQAARRRAEGYTWEDAGAALAERLATAR